MGGILLLEDGRRFEGEAFGAHGVRVGEVVFNTAMTGYQEVLTDPSYCEQIIVMTVPHVGNYGVNDEDCESRRVWASGFVVRDLARRYSNFRAQQGLDHYLRTAGVPSLQGIDTRALVRHIRDQGAMKAVICTDGTPLEKLQEQLQAWPGMEGRALAQEVAAAEPYLFADPAADGKTVRARVTVVDGGVKTNILRMLGDTGCRVKVVPIHGSAKEWMDDADLLFFGNGPGDPAALPGVVENVKEVMGKLPMVGICLGHQLLGLALDADTFKLRFGHRGANHPVRDVKTGRVEITSQNHGFCVDPKGVERAGGRVTHVNLNDGTLEGFAHDDHRIMAVQFHPESAPGPRDSGHLIVDRYLSFCGF